MDFMTISLTLAGLLVLSLGSSLWIGVALALGFGLLEKITKKHER